MERMCIGKWWQCEISEGSGSIYRQSWLIMNSDLLATQTTAGGAASGADDRNG